MDVKTRWMEQISHWFNLPYGLSRCYVNSVLPLAHEYGLEIESILDAAGVDPTSLKEFNDRVPLYSALKIFKAAIELTGDEYLAIRASKEISAQSHRAFSYVDLHYQTLGQAMVRLMEFEKLVWDLGVTRMVHSPEYLHLEWKIRGVPDSIMRVP
jgi:hypothetical protein